MQQFVASIRSKVTLSVLRDDLRANMEHLQAELVVCVGGISEGCGDLPSCRGDGGVCACEIEITPNVGGRGAQGGERCDNRRCSGVCGGGNARIFGEKGHPIGVAC